MISIAVINASVSLLDDQTVRAVVPSLQTQISRDFAPAWGNDAVLTFVPSQSTPPGDSWWLVIADNSAQAGFAGYRDLTPEGLPLAKVLVGTSILYGDAWTVAASHQLLEMLADPDISHATSFVHGQGPMTMCAYEIADPCAADSYGYLIDGTLVSDFVYPEWFLGFRLPGSTQFDFNKQIYGPFEVLPGGSVTLLDPNSSQGWQRHPQGEEREVYRWRTDFCLRYELRRLPLDQRVLTQSTSIDRAETPSIRAEVNAADVAQFFETTVAERKYGSSFRFVSVPARSIGSPNLLTDPAAVAGLLKLESVQPLTSRDELSSALARILLATRMDQPAGLQAVAHEFANYCTSTPLIPFEQSPLDLASLGGLLTATGVGVGAFVGFVAGAGTPLVLLTVPAGMIICGAAAGVARTLETGLQYRLVNLMGVPQPTIRSRAPRGRSTAARR